MTPASMFREQAVRDRWQFSYNAALGLAWAIAITKIGHDPPYHLAAHAAGKYVGRPCVDLPRRSPAGSSYSIFMELSS